MTKFTMKRTGQFEVKTSGLNHCGIKNPLKINYTFLVECGEGSLDSRGFLFDQMKVQKFFDNIKEVSLSCEVFARQASRDLFKLVKAENEGCDINRLCLTLSPEPFQAELTFEWEPNGNEATGKVVDHIDGDPHNNDIKNLRVVSAPKSDVADKKKAMYKGRTYDVLAHNKRTNVYRLSFEDGSKSFYAKGGLVTPLDEKQDGFTDGHDYQDDISDDGEEFGYSGDAWFDLVNGMDVGEYERFKKRLRNDRKTGMSQTIMDKAKANKADLDDVLEAF